MRSRRGKAVSQLKMFVKQMGELHYAAASSSSFSQAGCTVTLNPTWAAIERAVHTLDGEHFMLLLSTKNDVECVCDEEALAIDFLPGFGFSLFQSVFAADHDPAVWRTKLAGRCFGQSDIDLNLALRLAAIYTATGSFNALQKVYLAA